MSTVPPPAPEYKGAPLDAERGPGLGCFWIQVVVLVLFIILAPLSAVLNWGPAIATLLLACPNSRGQSHRPNSR